MGPMAVAAANYCMQHPLEQGCIDFARKSALIDQIGPWVIAAEIGVLVVAIVFRWRRAAQ